MAIPDTIIDKIQEKSDIVEVISGYIPLKKVGRNYKTTCPFHHEKTPSFVVSPDKQIYHCFGCGVGGNVFSFLMKYENLQFPEVVEMLAKKTGVMLPRIAGRRDEENAYTTGLYKINELACQFFQVCLANNTASRDYLASRGIGDEAIKNFRIGYAPDQWEGALNFFKSKSVTGQVLEKAGLAISNDKGGHYDRFRNRVIFPITDLKNRTLGFGARVLDSSLPKYINSPETPIYSKGRNLYGLHLSREAIKKEGYALVVEGYLDFIMPYQAGIRNIIATLGTALTVDQIILLKRFTNTVIMVYDPDEAGEAASLRNLDLFISEDVNVYIAELPGGLDPDGYIRKFGADDFLKLVKSSKNLFDYKLDKLMKRFNINTSNGKTSIAGEMLPTLSRINNAVLKSTLIKKLSDKLSVDEEALKVELKKVKTGYSERRYIVNTAPARIDKNSAELIVTALLIEGGSLAEKALAELSADEFRNSSARELVKLIFSLHKDNIEISPARLISHTFASAETANLISEAVGILEIIKDKDKTMSDCISRIKKDNLRERLNMLQESIRSAHSQKDDERMKALVAEYNDLVKMNKA
ncbi:MAG: DNA primase [Candidatus Omnitrophota bacterium]|nr:DNA primase [Candidatus Omnitrophota bacterium]